jgi:hypothetical protein
MDLRTQRQSRSRHRRRQRSRRTISRALAAEAAIPVIVDRDVEAANESFRLHPKSAQWVSDPERFTALWRDFPP